MSAAVSASDALLTAGATPTRHMSVGVAAVRPDQVQRPRALTTRVRHPLVCRRSADPQQAPEARFLTSTWGKKRGG
jgi:hypothetical protein